MILYIAFEGVNASSSAKVHGGGTYSRWLVVQLQSALAKSKRTDISIHILWPKGVRPSTPDEKTIYNNNSLYIEEISDIEEVQFAHGDKLFIPILESCTANLSAIKHTYPGLRIESVIHGVRNYDLTRWDIYQKYYHTWYKPIIGMGALSYVRQLQLSMREVNHIRSACRILDTVYTDSASSMALIDRLAHPKRINYFQPLSFIPGSMSTKNHSLSSDRYVLSISANRPEKNIIRSLVAFSQYKLRMQNDNLFYYIVGANDYLRKNITHVRDIDKTVLENSVKFFGYVTSEQLVHLFQECYFLLYASRSEGFGLPLLDAMIAGRPAVTSLITSMPEVVGSAAYYVDPYDTDSIERGIAFMSDQANNERYSRYMLESRQAMMDHQKIDSERLVDQILFG